jgi:Tol biopolymer transport system component
MRRLVFPAAVTAFFLVAQQQTRPEVRSFISTIDIGSGREHVVWSGERHFEAPNWSPDGMYLLVNSSGRLWKLPVSGGEPVEVNTGSVNRVNNDHGISPDGKTFVISAGHMYTLPASGGSPKQITRQTPSYYHGWSPDGRTLAYCARRNDNFDVYTIPVDGGEEKRLTMHPGYDDGPDYSPNGQWIYFNSDRSGSWDIWRIPASGAGPEDARAERITSDDEEDWFPHPSPDGQWMVWISFDKGTKGHPANQHVRLKLAPAQEGKPIVSRVKVVKELFGGQGTINVNSWAPDSRRFAYVRYELIDP